MLRWLVERLTAPRSRRDREEVLARSQFASIVTGLAAIFLLPLAWIASLQLVHSSWLAVGCALASYFGPFFLARSVRRRLDRTGLHEYWWGEYPDLLSFVLWLAIGAGWWFVLQAHATPVPPEPSAATHGEATNRQA